MSYAAAAAAKSLQSCPTLCEPIDGSPPGSSIPGILQARTLEWLPFPSPMHESEKWKWSCSVVSDSLRPHGLQPTRLLHPWDFPGKSTGAGCHCLLRCHMLAVLKSVDFRPAELESSGNLRHYVNLSQTHWIRNQGQKLEVKGRKLCFNKLSGWLWWKFMFENHCRFSILIYP